MKLKRNSWHGKLNSFTWGKGYLEDVDCLCPYFWGTVAAILGFPLTLLAKGIIYLIEHIPSTNWSAPTISENTRHKIAVVTAYSGLALGVYILTYIIVSSIVTFGLLQTLIWIGIVTGIVALVVVFSVGVVKIIESLERREKRPNLLIEMFKAKKNKHCPLVSWID